MRYSKKMRWHGLPPQIAVFHHENFRTQPWKFQKNPWCSMIFLFVEPRWKKISSYSLKPISQRVSFFHRLGKVPTTSLKHQKTRRSLSESGPQRNGVGTWQKKKRPGTIRNSWRPFLGCEMSESWWKLLFLFRFALGRPNWPMKLRANIRQLETILRNNLPHLNSM